MRKKKKIQKQEVQVNFLYDKLSIGSIGYSDFQLTTDTVKRMLKQLDVAIPINALIRSVKGRSWTVRPKKGINDEILTEEINSRLGNIENIDQVIEEVINAKYFGSTIFEIIYNEDFTIRRLELVPRDRIYWNYSKKTWSIWGIPEESITPEKFLICTHKASLEYPEGKSDLEPMVKTYTDLVSIENKIRAIQEKYGDTVPIFAYDSRLGETADGREKVKEQAIAVAGISKGSVMAIPVIPGSSLKDGFSYISLTDLKIEIHQQLKEEYEKKIKQYLLGGTLTMDTGSSGSYALGGIHELEKEKVEEEIISFVIQELQPLINIDNLFFGSDNRLTFFADKPRNLKEEAELELQLVQIEKIKLENLKALVELGNTINSDFVKEYTKIDFK